MIRATPSVSLPASFHTYAQPKIALSLLFAATSETLQKRPIRGRLTPLFSSCLSYSSCISLTLAKTNPLFPTTSQKHPGWGSSTTLLNHYLNCAIPYTQPDSLLATPLSQSGVGHRSPITGLWPLPFSCATLFPANKSTRHCATHTFPASPRRTKPTGFRACTYKP